MPRIVDPGQPGIADHRDVPPRGEFLDEFRRAPRFVVLVIGDQRLGDPVMTQQNQRMPRVFTRDHIRTFQRLQRTQRDIAEISDGGGDEAQQV